MTNSASTPSNSAPALATLLEWAEGVLESTDPENPESYFNDHARECCEAIAFDNTRPEVLAAIAELRAGGAA